VSYNIIILKKKRLKIKKILDEVESTNLKLVSLKEKINSLCEERDKAFNKDNIVLYNKLNEELNSLMGELIDYVNFYVYKICKNFEIGDDFTGVINSITKDNKTSTPVLYKKTTFNNIESYEILHKFDNCLDNEFEMHKAISIKLNLRYLLAFV